VKENYMPSAKKNYQTVQVRRDFPDLPEIIKGVSADTLVQLGSYGFNPEDRNCEGLFDPTQDPQEMTIGDWLPLVDMWHRWFHEFWHLVELEADLALVEDEEKDTREIYNRLATAMLNIFILNGWKLPGEK
jgi:hypothetical protein